MLRDVHYCRVTRSHTMDVDAARRLLKKRRSYHEADELYECLAAAEVIVPFVPTLKALCMAVLGNTSREREVSRVDRYLYPLYNTQVRTCERPYRRGLRPHWTGYPTLVVKANKVTTRHGPHFRVLRQCVSCWLRDPYPCNLYAEYYT